LTGISTINNAGMFADAYRFELTKTKQSNNYNWNKYLVNDN